MSAETYVVRRAEKLGAPSAQWEAPAWRDVAPLIIANPMGSMPSHLPLAQAKLRYDARHLGVIFRVDDRFVRAAVTRYQGSVCTDSCVELFFTPGTDTAEGYFNIEANCCGVLLFRHQRLPDVQQVEIAESDARLLCVAHTLPGPVLEEIREPVSWCVEYQVPFSMLRRYAPVALPRPGESWRANLYKCADGTSHPHWLTWSRVDLPSPDFHRPEYFGTLVFGG